MTLKIIPLVLFILALNSTYIKGQTGWNWLNPKPQGNTLLDLQVINSNVFYAVGEAGTILKTTNAGSSWNQQRSRTNLDINGLSFVHSDSGYVVGDSGLILKTFNSGKAWFRQSSGTILKLKSVAFVSSKLGWVVGGNGLILKTTNGGLNWIPQNSPTTKLLTRVFFVSTNIGWAVGDEGTILKTINGGDIWIAQTGGVIEHLTDVSFTNTDIGFVVGANGTVLKTQDGGAVWNPLITGATTTFYTVKSIEADTLFIGGGGIGESPILLKSFDRGATWLGPATQPELDVYALDMLNSNQGLAIGNGGYLLKTEDGFELGTNLKSGFSEDIADLFFFSPDTGFAIGSGAGGFQQTLKTVNGGQSWVPVNYNGTILQPLDIDFINPNIGFICGTAGKFYKTTNRGDNWLEIVVPAIVDPIRSLSFVNTDTGLVVGKFQIIRKTTNGGQTWIPQTGSGNGNLFDVQLFSGGKGFTAGENGIQFTSNGGTNWALQYSNDTINSFHFFNNQSGFAVGNRGKLLITTNAGLNWNIKPLPTKINLYKILFGSASNGIIVGDSGLVFRTNDGGATWNRQISYNRSLLKAAYLVNDTAAYIAGNNGTILKTTTGGSTCPDATFSYQGIFLPGKFCQSDTITQTLYFDGTPGGVFSSAPVGLNLNPVSGKIDPSLSQAGPYTVTYTVTPPNGCPPQVFNTTAQIQAVQFIPRSRLEVKRPPYSIPPQTIYLPCDGDTLITRARNRLSNYKFTWYKDKVLLPDTNQELTVTKSGLYAVKYRQEACLGAFFDTVQIDFKDEAKPLKPSLNLSQPQLTCNGNFTLSTNLQTGLNYQWVDEFGNAIPGQNGTSYTSNRTGTFRIQIDSLGCKNLSAPIKLIPVNADTVAPNLFTVSTNGTNISDEKNTVFWNRITYDTLDVKRVIVYRAAESASFYTPIAEIPATDSAFKDTQANPGERGFSYRISAKQLCGTDLIFSPSSTLQNSVNLKLSNHPPNLFILQWTEPEGYKVSKYKIYRGLAYNNLSVLKDSISGMVTSYMDTVPGTGPFFYRVEAETNKAYFPWGRINAIKRTSSSNTSNTTFSFCDSCQISSEVPIKPKEPKIFHVYPNPHSESFFIEGFGENETTELALTDVLGKILYRESVSGKKKHEVRTPVGAGLYTLKVSDFNKTSVFRIMKY